MDVGLLEQKMQSVIDEYEKCVSGVIRLPESKCQDPIVNELLEYNRIATSNALQGICKNIIEYISEN